MLFLLKQKRLLEGDWCRNISPADNILEDGWRPPFHMRGTTSFSAISALLYGPSGGLQTSHSSTCRQRLGLKPHEEDEFATPRHPFSEKGNKDSGQQALSMGPPLRGRHRPAAPQTTGPAWARLVMGSMPRDG